MEKENRPTKFCFVTVGATASFNALVQEVVSAPFLEALRANHYTHLVVQYGQGGESVYQAFKDAYGREVEEKYGVYVWGFDYKVAGLKEEFKAVKVNPEQRREEGVVISHAGTGTILEVMRFGIPLVVVPNPELMHNHQEELAKQLESVGYVLHGRLGNLHTILNQVEDFRVRLHMWPPVNRFDEKGIQSVMDDELGFVD
ncbi:hypothetical protein VTO42DRAFT_2844 [Malbranchea cinnamomea]